MESLDRHLLYVKITEETESNVMFIELMVIGVHVHKALAASSAVLKVPSHTLWPCLAESRISAANFPHGRRRTPRYRTSPLSSLSLPFDPSLSMIGVGFGLV
ncbi:hypothetical protein Lal_00047363 [Lupinus albus]|nr:hypothetical protein Lal_00047363 [Lupinus albus]